MSTIRRDFPFLPFLNWLEFHNNIRFSVHLWYFRIYPKTHDTLLLRILPQETLMVFWGCIRGMKHHGRILRVMGKCGFIDLTFTKKRENGKICKIQTCQRNPQDREWCNPLDSDVENFPPKSMHPDLVHRMQILWWRSSTHPLHKLCPKWVNNIYSQTRHRDESTYIYRMRKKHTIVTLMPWANSVSCPIRRP